MAKKHLYWVSKNKVKDSLRDKGASFVEEVIVENIVKDVIETKEEKPKEPLNDIVEDVVQYYLSELFSEKSEYNAVDSLDVSMEDDESRLSGGKGKLEEAQDKIDKAEEKVTCKLCLKRYKVLYPHLIAKHNITADQYRKQFPDAKLRAGVPEAAKTNKKKSFSDKLYLLKSYISEKGIIVNG